MGLSIAILLAQHNEVTSVDIVQERVDLVNQHKSPIQDDFIEAFFLVTMPRMMKIFAIGGQAM